MWEPLTDMLKRLRHMWEPLTDMLKRQTDM